MAEGTDLAISLGLDPTPLRNGLNEAERLVRNTSSQITKSLDSIGDIGERLAKVGTILSASITLPLLTLSKSAITAYGDLQALELGIEAVAGSATYAGKQMESLREIAKLPGLGLKEAAKGSVGLQAIGYSAGNAEKILLQFGNAIATVGKGRVEFDRAIYGVQQLANTDFPLGEDLNIIKDALPQVSTLLKAAFGTSRTEDLQKLKVSSKQVMDVILKGLEKLPRVSGGIKNAFENLGDSIQQNLARIGERIDKAFDISGIINRLTDLMDDAITAFEELSPAMQKTILVITALVAGIGPLLLGIGGFLALVPLLVSGITAIGTAITATVAFMTSWVGIIAGLIVGATALGAAIAYLATRQSEAEENQERWNKSLSRATASAQTEIAALDVLYKKTQDHGLSIEERNKAIDQAQKEYPGYLGNISDEAFRAGGAAKAYEELRKGILNASLARAAQSELDKRSEVRLNREIEMRERLNKVVSLYKDPSLANFAKLNSQLDKGFLGLNVSERLNPDEISTEGIKKAAAKYIFNAVKELKTIGVAFDKENKVLYDKISGGIDAIAKLDVVGPDTFLPGLDKVKKETQKQLAEIFPKGSIAELQQRADLLKKAIETSVNDIVKVRGIDKFGKNVDKKGLPIFTGEIIGLENAKERLEQLLAQISLLEVKPPEGITDFKAFRAEFTNELNEIAKAGSSFEFGIGDSDPFAKIIQSLDNLGGNSLGKLTTFKNAVSSNLQSLSVDASNYLNSIGNSFLLLPQNLALGINSALVQTERFKKIKEDFNKDLNSLIDSSISQGLVDMFNSIQTAMASGGNAIEAVGLSLLSSIGSILIDLGKLAITTGVGLLAITTALKSLNPYVALAAGAALVALGSLVKGSVSKLGSASSSGGGGGSSSVSTSTGAGAGMNYSNNYSAQGKMSTSDQVTFEISGQNLKGVLNRVDNSNQRLNANN